jgi:nucleotide-binding universal stress UspA family protein
MSILLCYDDSDSARRALAVAQRTLGHQAAILLHVYRAPEAVLADAFSTRGSDPAGGAVSQERLESLASRRAREVLSTGRAIVSELDATVEVEAREAPHDVPVWRAILDVADEVDAELIVAGTHGPTAVAEQALGSVSGGLVHHSHRPVLIVPAAG